MTTKTPTIKKTKDKQLVCIEQASNYFVVRFIGLDDKGDTFFCKAESYVRALQLIKKQGFSLQLNLQQEESKFTTSGINVLSLFNGLGSIWVALDKLGIKVNKRYSSEIDKFCNFINDKNYPNTIQLGDIRTIDTRNLENIDLLVGGSPCQGLSFNGKQSNFNDLRSKLFFEFVRIKNEVNPRYFLFENTKMSKINRNIISKYLGVQPLEINSKRVSAQVRKRLYWTNIQLKQMSLFKQEKLANIPQPKNKNLCIADIMQKSTEIDKKFYLKKGSNYYKKIKASIQFSNFGYNKELNPSSLIKNNKYSGGKSICFNSRKDYYQRTSQQDRVYHTQGKSPCLTASLANILIKEGEKLRRITPVECERLQTVPDNYTQGVNKTQRYKMLGNGWTVDVIAHILSFM